MTSSSDCGLRHVDAGLQAGDDLVVVVLADGPLGVGEGERDPEVLVGRAPRTRGEACRHDADDGVAGAVEGQGLADDIGARAEPPLPEAVAEHHDMAAAGRVLLVEEGASERRARPKNPKEPRPDSGRDRPSRRCRCR